MSWELVSETRSTANTLQATTERMRVEGGWIYRVRVPNGVSTVLVPDPERPKGARPLGQNPKDL